MRDNIWLERELEGIWQRYFPDVEKLNKVEIKFGRKARTRLGSIRSLPDGSSLVLINSLLKQLQIPDFVIKATIAHELVHYAHGFSSPHKQKYSHPHKGSVVKNDMHQRGMGEILVLQKKWIKNNWKDFLDSNYPITCVSKKIRKRRKRIVFVFR